MTATEQSPEHHGVAPIVQAVAQVVALNGEPVGSIDRAVAVEAPVQVLFGDIPFAVMMLTPSDLVDFAYGFSLTEGVVDGVGDIRDVRVAPADGGVALRIDLKGDKLHRHLARQRAMTGRTGCGVCGIDDIAALRRARGLPPSDDARPAAVAAIERALALLEDGQVLNAQTRAVHGAAWAASDGTVLAVREDVGRHNALDKLIGAALRDGTDPAAGFALITSRCSFEMVEKAATFGARTLVAISAPTSLAIERARALGVTLVAIARRDTVTVFTGTVVGGESVVTAGAFTRV